MVNEFYEAVKSDNEGAMKKLLVGMVEYADFHFKFEEKYFDQFKYPLSEEHKKEHKAFVEKALDIKQRVESGEMVISMELTNFIKS